MIDLTRDPLARELLGRIAAPRAGASVQQLFDGFSPKWAVAAADRLRAAGLIHADANGVLTLTALGRAARQARPIVAAPAAQRPKPRAGSAAQTPQGVSPGSR
ncbi:MAG: hypothetical protein JWO38_4450 [Gemmataceae bacterium]|nr:hypothetical protein [Gemmataceae bacterium]